MSRGSFYNQFVRSNGGIRPPGIKLLGIYAGQVQGSAAVLHGRHGPAQPLRERKAATELHFIARIDVDKRCK